MNLKFIRRLAYRAAAQLRRPFPCRRLAWQTFLDTHQEWHALVEGLGDGFCFLSYNLVESLSKERHYYKTGRAIGFALLLAYIAGIVALMLWLHG